MADRVFEGVFPYLVSPVDEGGAIREEVLRSLVEHLIASGVHGLSPLGSTGEFAYLTWPQRKRVIEVVIEAARGRVPVVPGVSHTSTREAVRQAREAEALGADGVLAILETYFPVPAPGVVAYFRAIAEAVSCPVVLYTNPNFSGTNLSLDVLSALVEVPNILYLKDASSNTGHLLSLMNRLGDRLRFFSASAHIPLFVMMLGGVGWMSGPACVVPRQSVTLFELARAGRWEEALHFQKRLWRINDLFQKHALAACIKAALELQGFAVGAPIPPQQPLAGAALAEVKTALLDLGALSGPEGSGAGAGQEGLKA